MEPARKRPRLDKGPGCCRGLIKRVLEETVVWQTSPPGPYNYHLVVHEHGSGWNDRLGARHLRLHHRNIDPLGTVQPDGNGSPVAQLVDTPPRIIVQILEDVEGHIVGTTTISPAVSPTTPSTPARDTGPPLGPGSTPPLASPPSPTSGPGIAPPLGGLVPPPDPSSPTAPVPGQLAGPPTPNPDPPTRPVDLPTPPAPGLPTGLPPPIPSIGGVVTKLVPVDLLPSPVKSLLQTAANGIDSVVAAAATDGPKSIVTAITADVPNQTGIVVAASLSAGISPLPAGPRATSNVAEVAASLTLALSIGPPKATDGAKFALGGATVLAVPDPPLSALSSNPLLAGIASMAATETASASAQGMTPAASAPVSAATVAPAAASQPSGSAMATGRASILAAGPTATAISSQPTLSSQPVAASLSTSSGMTSFATSSVSPTTLTPMTSPSSPGFGVAMSTGSTDSAMNLTTTSSSYSLTTFTSLSTLPDGSVSTMLSTGTITDTDSSMPTGAGAPGARSSTGSLQPSAGAGNTNAEATAPVPVPTVVGGVVGGVAGLAFVFFALLLLFRWQHNRSSGKRIAAAGAGGSGGASEMRSSATLSAPFIAAAALARKWRRSDPAELPAGEGERSFVKVSGRKLPPGGDGYGGGYDDEKEYAGSFLRPDSGEVPSAPPSRGVNPNLAGGPSVRHVPPGSSASGSVYSGLPPPVPAPFPEVRDSLDMFKSAPPSPPREARLSDGEGFWMRPGPARTAQPGTVQSGPSAVNFPTPPRTLPRFGGAAGQDRLGMSRPDQNGSRTSRFSEQIE